jgi:hypothetical protein
VVAFLQRHVPGADPATFPVVMAGDFNSLHKKWQRDAFDWKARGSGGWAWLRCCLPVCCMRPEEAAGLHSTRWGT